MNDAQRLLKKIQRYFLQLVPLTPKPPPPPKFPLATTISEYLQHVVLELSHCQALVQQGSCNLHITWSDQWIASCLIILFDLATESTRWAFDWQTQNICGTPEDQMLKKVLTRQVSEPFFYFLMNYYPMRVTLLFPSAAALLNTPPQIHHGYGSILTIAGANLPGVNSQSCPLEK